MKRLFQLYVREHHTGWFTTSVLTLPYYAAFGPRPSELRDELAKVLARDLATETLELRGETFFDELQQRSINVTLKAVQHDRLITVPMRFTILVRPIRDETNTFEIRIPRLGQTFRIYGEENIQPWAEEVIRGQFHLREVSSLLQYRFEKSERIDQLEVSYFGAGRYKKFEGEEPDDETQDDAPREPLQPSHPLAAIGRELTAEAKSGALPRAHFRSEAVAELLGILSSRRSPNALLVGPSGVGKTALVQEAAHLFALNRAGETFNGTKIWFIGGARMIAGAKFLGEWQQRVQWIVQLVQQDRDILYAGNILELMSFDTGKTGLNVAQFLLPAILSGDLSMIVEATPDSLSRAEMINAPFVRAFQRLPVPSLALEHTTSILERAAVRLEKEQNVKWAPGAVSSALDVVARFGDAEALPGSGLELLEQMARLAPGNLGPGKPRTIEAKNAIAAFSKSSGFPETLLDPEQPLDVAAVRRFFESRVIGQPRAMELLINVIMLLKAGLNDPQRPLGSFLFMGPTGVGKTESALTLAEYLFGDRKRLLRFDMSEFGYPGSAIRLVDGPDGQGELTKVIREQPFSVVLFDEVEKADAGVFDVLLQVLGEGRLTDGTGRTVRFTHTIVILTSNLGAMKKDAVGFAGSSSGVRRLDQHYLEAAAKFFRPEMINRLDHIVPYAELDQENIRAIAVRLLDAAIAREGFTRRGLEVRYAPEVLDVLAKAGFDPRYGARPMKRAVESGITVPIAKLLMTWPQGQGGRIEVGVLDGEVAISSSMERA